MGIGAAAVIVLVRGVDEVGDAREVRLIGSGRGGRLRGIGLLDGEGVHGGGISQLGLEVPLGRGG